MSSPVAATRPAPAATGGARSRVRAIASYLGLAVVAVLVAALIFVAAAPYLIGWHFVIVGGGSMEPTIPYGSLAIVEDVSPSAITPGDIITFAHPAYRGKVVTHRVVAISPDGQVTTRGDANGLPDEGTIGLDHVQHRFLFEIPHLGNTVRWIGSRTGLVTLVFIPGALLILVEVQSIWRAVQRHRAGSVVALPDAGRIRPARSQAAATPSPEPQERRPGRERITPTAPVRAQAAAAASPEPQERRPARERITPAAPVRQSAFFAAADSPAWPIETVETQPMVSYAAARMKPNRSVRWAAARDARSDNAGRAAA